jgi:hypothetical protein
MTENEAPWWASLEGLPAMVKALAQARECADYAASCVSAQEAVLAETQEYQFLQAYKKTLTDARDHVAALDAAVRKAALDDFRQNGEKAVYAGVSVKMFSRAEYEPAQLRDWLLDHQSYRALLTVDGKKAEALAVKGLMLDAPITITKEPRVQIATDLSGYLAPPLTTE